MAQGSSRGRKPAGIGYGGTVAQEAEVRSFDGSGNNRANPRWGTAGAQLLRMAPAHYTGGISKPGGLGRPNPLAISDKVCRQGSGQQHPELTDFMWAWGQFLDHEIDLTPEGMTERFDIPAFGRRKEIEFHRSAFDPGTGANHGDPRQQVNVLSAYVDGANVYGADPSRAAYLRSHSGGRLRTQVIDGQELLPFNEHGLPNAMLPKTKASDFFIAGDIRANEHGVLTSMHTLFALEHNRRCGRGGDDERVYQRSRRQVGAVMQVITYQEFLPALLGDAAFGEGGAIGPYRGYDPRVNAGITNLFSTACYRLGHSMLSEKVQVAGGRPLPLEDLFFRPDQVVSRGIAPFLVGLAQQRMQDVDVRTVDAVRTLLFNMGKDLAALNIQRGRDHGLPPLNGARAALGLRPHASFRELTSDAGTRRALGEVYDHVDDVDVWVGGLAEDHVNGATVGELFYVVLCDQFRRLRDGDRFWYENDPAFSERDRRDLRRTRLSDVIERNLHVKVRRDVFRLSGSKKKASRKKTSRKKTSRKKRGR